MNIPIESQTHFINWQIKEIEDSFRTYLKTSMLLHIKNKTAFKGIIWGIDDKRQSLIIQFPKGYTPRLKNPFLGLVFSGVPNHISLDSWNFSYEFFRNNYTKNSSSFTTNFYLKNSDSEYNYIGCRDFDSEFYEKIKDLLQKEKKPSIICAESDPPLKYLFNLGGFIKHNPTDKCLLMNVEKTLSDWIPQELLLKDDRENTVIEALMKSDEIIIQGPPGTGKSHLIAEITNHFLTLNKSVCVASMANKALIEIVHKPGVRKWLDNNKVFKTNLTYNEKTEVKNLQKANSLTIGKGELLLSSYYKLSEWYDFNNPESQSMDSYCYDLIIIEEASQAFLVTLAAFRKLGKKIIIVGDPYQLAPIVLNESSSNHIHPQIHKYITGLETYASNSQITSFILTETFRLSPEAAKLTSLFYDKALISLQANQRKINLGSAFSKYEIIKTQNCFLSLPLISDGDKPQNAIDIASQFAFELLNYNQDIEVAVLAPFKNTVLALQEKLGAIVNDFPNLTIETIDRVQGLTVDYTIVVLPLNNPTFALNLNRFNVATSRAKIATLIISDDNYLKFKGIDKRVTQYLSALHSLNNTK